MTEDAKIVFAILAGTIVLFLSEKIAIDLIGILSLLALYFTGILTVGEILSGFSNPIIITLGALFVLGGALFQTGVAATIGDWLTERGSSSQTGLLAGIMSMSAFLSAFMSSTGTAAILIPAITSLAKRGGRSASKLLMPLAYGCLIGGMLTLVGTPPNLVVQEALLKGGFEPFHFFSFTPMGLIVLLLATVYMATIGIKLLPVGVIEGTPPNELSGEELAKDYLLTEQIHRFRIKPDSMLVETRLSESGLRKGDRNLIAFQSDESGALDEPYSSLILQAGQILHIKSKEALPRELILQLGLEQLPALEDYEALPRMGGVAELLLTPRSRLLGQTLASSRFQQRYRVNVVSIRRRGKLLDHPERVKFRFADAILVAGKYEALQALLSERENLVVTGMPKGNIKAHFRHNKAWLAVALALAMLILMTLNLVPSVIATVVVALCCILLGCLSPEQAYRGISWQSLILIAAMLPMAQALQKTGGIETVASWLTTSLGGFGPEAIMAGLFILTSLFSQFISNTATTVLMTPVALAAAAQSGLTPQAFLMAVAVAASSAFVTPVASPVNLLVLSPGHYSFRDFVKVGLPLQILVLLVSLAVLPWLFPLR